MNINVGKQTFEKNSKLELGLPIKVRKYEEFSKKLLEFIREYILTRLDTSDGGKNYELRKKIFGFEEVSFDGLFCFNYPLFIRTDFLKEILLSPKFSQYIIIESPHNKKIGRATKINAVKLFIMEKIIEALEKELGLENREGSILRGFPRENLYKSFKKYGYGIATLVSKAGTPNASFANAKGIDGELFLEEVPLEAIKEDMKEGFKHFVEDSYWTFYAYYNKNNLSQEEGNKRLFQIVLDTIDAI